MSDVACRRDICGTPLNQQQCSRDANCHQALLLSMLGMRLYIFTELRPGISYTELKLGHDVQHVLSRWFLIQKGYSMTPIRTLPRDDDMNHMVLVLLMSGKHVLHMGQNDLLLVAVCRLTLQNMCLFVETMLSLFSHNKPRLHCRTQNIYFLPPLDIIFGGNGCFNAPEHRYYSVILSNSLIILSLIKNLL